MKQLLSHPPVSIRMVCGKLIQTHSSQWQVCSSNQVSACHSVRACCWTCSSIAQSQPKQDHTRRNDAGCRATLRESIATHHERT